MKKKIVYIAGYGRSGSTLLDIILGSHPEATNLGEVGNLFDLFCDKTSFCSCGTKYEKCDQWSEVLKRSFPDVSRNTLQYYKKVQHTIEKWTNLHRLLMPNSQVKERRIYTKFIGELLSGICNTLGNGILIDSTKNSYPFAWRALALYRLCGLDVRLIHLVRDGRGVINSKIKGNNKKMKIGLHGKEPFSAYRGLIGWILSNLFVIITRMFLPKGCYHLVRYEDLILNPDNELNKMGQFLHLDFSEVIERIQDGKVFNVGHLVAGNRITEKKTISIETRSVKDVRLAPHIKFLYYLLGWPIIAYLGIVSHRLNNMPSEFRR